MYKVFILAALWTVSMATSAWSVGQYKELSQVPDNQGLFDQYVLGLNDGIVAHAVKSDSPQPFCTPIKLDMTAKALRQVLDDFIEGLDSYHDDAPIGGALLAALEEAFPCPKE